MAVVLAVEPDMLASDIAHYPQFFGQRSKDCSQLGELFVVVVLSEQCGRSLGSAV